ncbi:MAG TPA: hypothetical protein VGM62_05025 [Chthoniobacterales bacterium]
MRFALFTLEARVAASTLHASVNRPMKPVRVKVSDKMQKDYAYWRTKPMGKGFRVGFKPQLTPKQMLGLGVFGGKYMNDCQDEFPASWFRKAKLSRKRHDASLNYFRVNASQPLSVWKKKGWIYGEDPRGWFQWYCRYYSGRRCADDLRQIARWRAVRRHVAQLKQNCAPRDLKCRLRQRQALLHWAYDSRKI